MFGWCGKLLRVDLSRGETSTEVLDPKVAKDFIGGRGLGIYYLLKEVDPACDPLSPQNLLVMAAGPLTGSGVSTGARYMVMTKSPLTGAITCSNSGGHFPTALKKAGWDGIIFSGKSEKPVYLWLEGQKAELRPAEHLWGLDSHQTEEALHQETHPKANINSIGPAGENLVLFSAIMNDLHRAAGRSGVGAVMGSKNLKAVVVRGRESLPLKDQAALKEINRRYLDAFKAAAKKEPPSLRLYGTAGVATVTNAYGVLPTHNWQQGTFEGAEKIDGRTLAKTYLKTPKACHSCPIGCGRGTEIADGPFAGQGEGPEYETVYALGSNCGVDDLAAITKANYLCNELGLDTITMGATIACAMEMAQKGYIPKEDVGFELKFGDGQALVELTRQTAYRQGFGEILAQGSLRLATRYGHPELAMVSKGQEFPGYDPRGEQGMGLAYATSPIGGSHMRGDPAYFELFGVPQTMDPQIHEGKGPIIANWQDTACVIDAAGLCMFYAVRYLVEPDLAVKPYPIMELLNAATGADYSREEILAAGERIFNAERLFLMRAGFDRKQDTLPKRLLEEPLPGGPAKGQVCRLEEMLDPYYEARGWDQNGNPTPEKLGSLGLGGY